MLKFSWILPRATLVGCLVVSAHAQGERQPVDFSRDVQPVLSNKCFACHGPDGHARKADLRLDLAAGLLEKRGDRTIVLPGQPDQSELYRRITATDIEQRMPPTNARHQLTSSEIEMFRRWIEEGAVHSLHWAYVPLDGVVVPAGADGVQPIDRFVNARLDAADIKASPRASLRVLARRLSHDLTGLPASMKFVTAIEKGMLSLEQYADQLLASPQYGERMAQHWLDLVRYADTVGYHGDQEWQMWPYRDHVIKSFNDNQPFDSFTIDQIGGDLLPEASMAQRVAAGYNRLNMVTFEGGSQAKEYLLKYAADRVRNLSTVWLGSTVGCAECHDHKFDPFTMEDFYSLSAFFADIEEVGVFQDFQSRLVPPQMTVAYPAEVQEREGLVLRVEALEQDLVRPMEALDQAQGFWEARILEDARKLTPVAWVDDVQGNGGSIQGVWSFIKAADGAPVHSGMTSRRQEGTRTVQHFFLDATETLHLGEEDQFFAWVFLDPQNPPAQIMLQFHVDGTWEHRAIWGEDLITFGGIGTDRGNHRSMGPLPKTGAWVRLEVSPEQVDLGPGRVLDGMAFTQFGGLAHWDDAGVSTRFPSLLGSPVGLAVRHALQLESSVRSEEQQLHVRKVFRSQAPELESKRISLASVRDAVAAHDASLPKMLATVSVTPRPVRILPRGDWMNDSGKLVQPDVPSFLHGPSHSISDQGATRLDLGRWLVSGANPLAARAFVNRTWRLFFGQGLAQNPGDLGNQGARPTHPLLLDWLSHQFVASGWDVKQLVRTIVRSQAYQRSSRVREGLAESDPNGILLARQRRWRMDAEFLRDGALAVSGLLVTQVGGPSVKPYQPGGHWRELNFPKRTWQQGQGEDLFRRSLYTFWCRTFLHPALDAFDAPSREVACSERNRSNTPQQALVLLNDPCFVEAARVLAARSILHSRVSSAMGDLPTIRELWVRVLARNPRPEEIAGAQALLDMERKRLAEDMDAAEMLVAVGETPRNKNIPTVELAAWTQVARLVLNLNETLTRF